MMPFAAVEAKLGRATVSIDHFNMQMTLATFRSQFQRNDAAGLAGASLAMIVPITAFLFLQRYVVAGLTAGSSR